MALKTVLCKRCGKEIQRRQWGICKECYEKGKAERRAKVKAKIRAEKSLPPYGSGLRNPICLLCASLKENKDSGYCNSCKREAASARRIMLKKNNPNFIQEERSRRKEKYSRCAEYRHKVKIQNFTWQAIKFGVLVPQPCEVCSKTENIDAHHTDYSKPLDVRWLCKSCHIKHHRELERNKATEQS